MPVLLEGLRKNISYNSFRLRLIPNDFPIEVRIRQTTMLTVRAPLLQGFGNCPGSIDDEAVLPNWLVARNELCHDDAYG